MQMKEDVMEPIEEGMEVVTFSLLKNLVTNGLTPLIYLVELIQPIGKHNRLYRQMEKHFILLEVKFVERVDVINEMEIFMCQNCKMMALGE